MTPLRSPGLAPGTRFRRVLSALSGGLAGVLLVLMMMVTVVDVVGRYFFNAPLPGGFEMTQFLMAGIVYAGLPRVSDEGRHITIDLLDAVTPEALARWRDVAVNALCAAFFALLAWRLGRLAGELAEWGETTQYLRWPMAPTVYFGAAMFALASSIFLVKLMLGFRPIPRLPKDTGA